MSGKRWLCFAFWLCVSQAAFAGCQVWTAAYVSGTYPSLEAIRAAVAASCTAGGECSIIEDTATRVAVVDEVAFKSTDPNVIEIHYHRIDPVDGSSHGGDFVGLVPTSTQTLPGECPCDGSISGTEFQTQFAMGASFPSSYCEGGSHCRVESSGMGVCVGDTCMSTYVGTSQSCDAQPPLPEDADTSQGEQCVGSWCEEQASDKGCGYLNGQWLCLGSVDDDGCQVLGDGGRACGSQAPVPPVPDNGTAGVPAPPDQAITINEGDSQSTINYYSSSTVAGSAREPNESGDNPYDGDDGSGSSSEGTGDEEGEGTCEEHGDCSAEGVGGPPEIAMPCYAAGDGIGAAVQGCVESAFSTAWDGITGAPVFALVGGLWESFGTGGVCPEAKFEAFDQEYDFGAAMCGIVDANLSLLSLIFQIGWSLIGVRILVE